MSVKRQDNKNRILRNGESQTADMYMFMWMETENRNLFTVENLKIQTEYHRESGIVYL